MRKKSALFFLFIYLFSTTEAHQLLKLPIVFQHYAEHQLEDKNISFIEFLDIHYMHGSPSDADYDRDMQLPFKSSVDCISNISFASVPAFIEFDFDRPLVFSTTKKSFPLRNQYLIFGSLQELFNLFPFLF
jgi:hypothetical protein